MLSLEDILAQLKQLGDEKVRKQNTKQGAGSNQFGVKLGELRKFAKKIKADPELAMSLWETGNIDARFLAILLLKPDALSADQIDRMVKSVSFSRVADWLNSYIINHHPDKEELRQKWLLSNDPISARSGWSLTAERVAKNPEGLDLKSLLDRIESEMGNAPVEVQWTMNFTLAYIGIHFPEYRERAIEIGESLGIFKDYPVSKGCTSPYAPIWIQEMVKRKN